METPYFQISEKILYENIYAFKNALKSIWPNSIVSYSIKTNSLPWVLKCMKKNGVSAEAVSDEEYQLAKMCGYEDSEIIFNGPIKGTTQLREALEKGAYVNVDSSNDVECVLKYKKKESNVGIRVNIPPECFEVADIGFTEDGFRFGYSDRNSDLSNIIELLKEENKCCSFGLHLHCNSITRSVDVYCSIASYAADLIRKYNLEPSYIDIGGGFFGGVEGKPTAEDYISAISEIFGGVVDRTNTKLIIEPGSAIIGSAIDLHTTVIDIKDTTYARIVTTDGSRVHVDPLWKKSGYMYDLPCADEAREKIQRQIICGYTCMDHDRIMVLENMPELKKGDKIVYKRVGAYTVTFGGAFIRYFPEVYLETEVGMEKIRSRMTVEDYLKIQTV